MWKNIHKIKQILKRLKVKNDLGNRSVVDARLANLEPQVPTLLLLCAVMVLLCAVTVLLCAVMVCFLKS